MVLQLKGGLVGFDEAMRVINNDDLFTEQMDKLYKMEGYGEDYGICYDVKCHEFKHVQIFPNEGPFDGIIGVNNANAILTIEPSDLDFIGKTKHESVLLLKNAFIQQYEKINKSIIEDKLNYFNAYQAGQISQYNISADTLYDYVLGTYMRNTTFYNFDNLEKNKISDILAIFIKRSNHTFLAAFPKTFYQINGKPCLKHDNFVVSIDQVVDVYISTNLEDLALGSVLFEFERFADKVNNVNLFNKMQIEKLTDYFMKYADLDPEFFSDIKNSIS